MFLLVLRNADLSENNLLFATIFGAQDNLIPRRLALSQNFKKFNGAANYLGE